MTDEEVKGSRRHFGFADEPHHALALTSLETAAIEESVRSDDSTAKVVRAAAGMAVA
jgi:hypothetical protein